MDVLDVDADLAPGGMHAIENLAQIFRALGPRAARACAFSCVDSRDTAVEVECGRWRSRSHQRARNEGSRIQAPAAFWLSSLEVRRSAKVALKKTLIPVGTDNEGAVSR